MTSESAAKKDIQKLQRAIVDGLEDVKAQEIVVFNTTELSPLFERVMIASGTSNRQTKALAASVRDKVREAGFDKPRVEGEDNGEWIIVNCGPAVVHIMQPVIRQYYRLEEIWGAKPVKLKSSAPAKPKAAKPAKPVKPVKEEVAAKKPGVKKSPAKKAGAAPASAKAPAKKATTKTAAKTGAKTVPGKKVAAKKPAAKKDLPKVLVNKPKVDAKKAPAKKAAAKTVPAKKVPAKTARKSAGKSGSRG